MTDAPTLKPCPFCGGSDLHQYDDEAEMVERVRKAVSPQISEGLGAVLRKFCDSDHAAKARFHLHAMPDSDWKTLIDMLSNEAARAALSAMRGES